MCWQFDRQTTVTCREVTCVGDASVPCGGGGTSTDGDRLAVLRADRIRHDTETVVPPFPRPFVLCACWVPLVNRCTEREEKARLGEETKTRWVENGEGMASVPTEGMERGNNGGGPTTRTKEKARRKTTEGERQGETEGQNMRREETALCYRLQIATFTQMGADEVAGEDRAQVVEKIHGIATTTGVPLS